ncbi:hypothetical protein GCM10022206_76660 [Streptomyces chiangmaiensis]
MSPTVHHVPPRHRALNVPWYAVRSGPLTGHTLTTLRYSTATGAAGGNVARFPRGGIRQVPQPVEQGGADVVDARIRQYRGDEERCRSRCRVDRVLVVDQALPCRT